MKMSLAKNTTILFFFVLVAVTSCTSYKKVPYLQNSRELDSMMMHAAVYEPVIQLHDMLNISVYSTQDQQAAMAFNLGAQNNGAQVSQQAGQSYIVDSNGCVNVPNVGEVHLAGLTISEAERLVLDKVKGSFATPPAVIVRFVDYEIAVLGEVKAPGMYSAQDGRITILQALADAGDLTVHGRRDNVKIIREEVNGDKRVYEVDLNDASLLYSPYYYLRQNDVVYVTPNKRKAKGADIGSATSLWFSGTSVAISLVSLMFNILR